MSDNIKQVAQNLRAAIERAKAADADIPWLKRFPKNCCNFACNLLLLDLSAAGIRPARRIMGTVCDEKGDELGSHVWVQAEHFIVDITADNFGQSPVIVDDTSKWHEQLDEVKPFIARIDTEDGIGAEELIRLEQLYTDALQTLRQFRSP